MSILLFITGLILFIGLVVVHEYGHFIAARRGGVEVEEFGIFFPPRLYKRKMRGGWNFTINLLPLGGFVKLKGEHDSDTEHGSFGAASLKTKSKIMVAGVFMNLATALALLTLLALVGMPKLLDNQFSVKSDTKVVSQKVLVGSVEPGSPAAKAGLKSADQIVAMGPKGQHLTPVVDSKSLPQLTQKYAGQTVTIEYSRSGHAPQKTSATLLGSQEVISSQKDYAKRYAAAKSCQNVAPPKGYLGLMPAAYVTQRSTWSAPITAIGLSAQITALTLKGLGSALGGLGSTIAGIVTGNSTARQNGECVASSQVSGPVGIFFIIKTGSLLGVQYMLMIIAIISLTLAIMNILPIPALDGGRLWMTLISRGIFKKSISAHREEVINASGFIVLILLIIVITFADVKRHF